MKIIQTTGYADALKPDCGDRRFVVIELPRRSGRTQPIKSLEQMRDLVTIQPKTLDGIKRLAKQLKKANGLAHHEALEAAAKQAGFESFEHARKALVKQHNISVPASTSAA